LDTCDSIDGTQVIGHEKEKDLLMGWFKFIEDIDPDVIIGHNIARFDLPYILGRANVFGLMPYLGRNTGEQKISPLLHWSDGKHWFSESYGYKKYAAFYKWKTTRVDSLSYYSRSAYHGYAGIRDEEFS